MPTYDYQCESCHHRFEVRQSFHDDPVAACPLCDSSARRRISLVPVIFKGSGWYVNDYGKKSAATSSENGAGKGDGLKDTKVEAKAADKKTPKAEKTDSKKETKTPTKKAD